MPIYSYQGLNQKGRRTKGNIFGYSEQEAINQLTRSGIKLNEIAITNKKVGWWNKPVGIVSFKDRIVFIKYLATILESGLSLKRALDTLSEQIKNKYFRMIIDNVRTSVENGQSFHESLGRHPKVFDKVFTSMVAAGELSGTMPNSLHYLEELLTKSHRFKKKIQGAMIYPSIVLVAAVAVVLGIVKFIVPQLLPIFDSFGSELSFGTRMLIAVESAFSNYWIILLLLSFAAIVAFIWLLKYKPARRVLDRWVLKIPFFGPVIKQVQVTRFTQIDSLLLHSGLTFVESIKVTSETIKNLVYREYLLEAIPYIESGGLLSEYLRKRPDMFDNTVIQMIALGEETGNLEKTMTVIADLYEEEVGNKLKTVAELVGPLVLIVVGAIIALIAVAVIGPIYRLPSLIKEQAQ